MRWAETLLWEICCFCSATTLAQLIFFPRNQVPHCYVTKVNNDSLNDPKKKNWRLAPLGGICTEKFDNVTNHSSKHYLKVFFLSSLSQPAACWKHCSTWLCSHLHNKALVFHPQPKIDTEKNYTLKRLCVELDRNTATAGLLNARHTALETNDLTGKLILILFKSKYFKNNSFNNHYHSTHSTCTKLKLVQDSKTRHRFT